MRALGVLNRPYLKNGYDFCQAYEECAQGIANCNLIANFFPEFSIANAEMMENCP